MKKNRKRKAVTEQKKDVQEKVDQGILSESVSEPIEQPEMKEKPEMTKEKQDEIGFPYKLAAVAVLFIIAVCMTVYFVFIGYPNQQFIPGTEITQEEFKDVFASAEKIYIVMDVRNANTSTISDNVLQCGIDFAASSGMGGKTVSYLSISSEGCVTPTNMDNQIDYCISMLQDGLAVYVMAGNGSATYYSNGMVVTVGENYTQGQCGITRLN
jgi:hypothetical protein